jgi:hypothetical protein
MLQTVGETPLRETDLFVNAASYEPVPTNGETRTPASLPPIEAIAPSQLTLEMEDARTGRRSMQDPAVLFVDDGLVPAFVQLAVALRRAGYRTIRVTTAGSWSDFLGLRRVAFDRLVRLGSSQIDRLEHTLDTEQIIDVQCTERVAVQTYRSLERSETGRRATGWGARSELIDKLNVAHLLDRVGIPSPAKLDGETMPAEAVRTLGLPIVLKPRVGSSGVGVSIVQTLTELEELYRDIANPGDVFFEAFVDGTPINYAAVVGPDSAERDMTYSTVRRDWRAGSPSIEITCQQDQAFIGIGRQLARALPCQGLLNVDAIRDHTGRYWVHDVNLRVWGAFFASRAVGFDLSAAYVRWLSDQVSGLAGDPERRVRVFPDYPRTVLRSKQPLGLLRPLRADIHQYRRWLGFGYVLYELARIGRGLLRGRWRTSFTQSSTQPAGSGVVSLDRSPISTPGRCGATVPATGDPPTRIGSGPDQAVQDAHAVASIASRDTPSWC